MNYNEARKTVDAIVDAIERGRYKVSYDGPNNIGECTAPDGRTIYVLYDMDGCTSSNEYGCCEVNVMGYTFTCDWGTGEVTNDFIGQLEDKYTLSDSTVVTCEDLVREVLDALEDADGVIFGEYVDMDSQMDLYADLYHVEDPEYYYFEDPDCPVDIEYMNLPSDDNYGTVHFKRRKYYLVEAPANDGNSSVHAVHCHCVPMDDGAYETALLTLTHTTDGKLKAIACEECRDTYNAVEKLIETD